MDIKSNALIITCLCGLARFLPTTVLEVGEEVSLPPCPKCSYIFKGTYTGNDTIETQI